MPRTTERHDLLKQSPGTHRSLLAYRYGTPGARPKAYLQASIHADETPAMLALHHLVRMLDRADGEGGITGEIVVVPFANPIGLNQAVNGAHSGRYNLDGSGNFNRNWPDLFAGLPERLDGRLTDDRAENCVLIRATVCVLYNKS